jgi:hypothetical protein
MRWLGVGRKYWDVGERIPFRLSRQRCTDLIYALVACDGRIHDTFSLDIHDGEARLNMKPHECAILLRISLPEGAEARFEEIMGKGILTDPPKIQLNSEATLIRSGDDG